MKNVIMLLGLIGVCLASGCTTTEKGAAVGGLGGATLGGIIGHQSGHGVEGAAIGGAAGVIGGMIVGEKMQDKENATQEASEKLVKFCPECGKGFTREVKFCPKDGVELKYKE